MDLPVTAAAWFLPFVAPICLWVAWSDMAFMKIPNKAVLALAAVYLAIGPLALPLEAWGWGWLHLLAVLVAGFLINMIGAVGAGDAKFAAAAAPFVAPGDIGRLMILFAAVLVAAFVTHRGIRLLPAARRLTPAWESWTRGDFPMGLALGGALLLYLVLALAA
jgi:prepilin peptidase CpaA